MMTSVRLFVVGVGAAAIATTLIGCSSDSSEDTADSSASTTPSTFVITGKGPMDEPEPSGTAVSTLTCGQLSAMDEVEQKRNVDELAKRLNKPLIYSNPDGYRTVVAYCGDPDDLVTDSLPFA